MKVTFGWQRRIAKLLLEPPVIKHTHLCICQHTVPTLSICQSLGLKCSKERTNIGNQLREKEEAINVSEQQIPIGTDSDIQEQ